ncbi:MAG: choice-of-anchor J domain-containing protein [Bacteroidota bacterium]|nr:choice-of-anchor J domain-containing protein [Bacteroidota bacterium]
MRKLIVPKLLWVCFAVFLISSCKDDSYLTKNPPVPNQSFHEEFDSASAALTRGWKFINASDPIGGGVWQNGGSIPPFFNAFSNNGSNIGFIGTDVSSTSAAQGVVSNWLVSPPVIMQNGDKIIFYTRALQYPDGSGDTTDYGNSLQLRLNTTNDDANVGNGFDPGLFTTGLLTINANLTYSSALHKDPTAYPSQWTRFEAIVSGLNKPVKGRFGFRYFVTDGGFNGNGSGVGIDAVSYLGIGN